MINKATPDFTEAIKAMQALCSVPGYKFSGMEIGVVSSVSPLSILIDGATITESFINVSPLCVEFKTKVFSHKHTYNDKNDGEGSSGDVIGAETSEELKEVIVWRGLEAGDKVALLRTGQSQQFIALFRIGKLGE